MNVFAELDVSRLDYYTNNSSAAGLHSTHMDSAYRAGLQLELFHTALKAEFISVGNEYYAPAAQTPVEDLSGSSSKLATQVLTRGFHELNYNNTISQDRHYNSSLSYSFPMNEATPNRQGFMFHLDSQAVDFLRIDGSCSILNSLRPVSCRNNRTYTAYAVQGHLDLSLIFRNRFFPVLTGFFSSDNQVRDNDTGTSIIDESENMTLSITGCGLEWMPFRSWSLLAGFDILREKGGRWLNTTSDADPLSPNLVSLYSSKDRFESILDVACVYTPGKAVTLRLDFIMQTYTDNLSAVNNYTVNSLRVYSRFLF